ncbi:conserved hypothetical protein [Candidatus Magnetomoraceae bacterium gMMP-15]
MEHHSREIVRLGMANLLKLVSVFLIILAISSIMIVSLGWGLKLAFNQFSLFEATLIPLLIVGFTSIMVGIISIWMRLGDLVFILDEGDFEDEEDEFFEDDEDEFLEDEEDEDYRLIRPSAKITPIHRKIKIGKNDPCPCGSRKKYKDCCGKDDKK